MEEERGEKTLCKQQSRDRSCSLTLLFKIGSILMMPILICALQSLLLSQVCISPSQLFFTSPKNREEDKVEAETCSPALD